MDEIKLFGKYSSSIEVKDPGLKRYICVTPKILPRTAGKQASKRFGKADVHIIERLINKLGISGHRGKKHKRTSGVNVGKTQHATKIMLQVMSEIEKKTNKNPVEVIVRAVENSAPMQETTVIEYGGIRHPRCVDVAPERRVDLSLRWITQGSFQNAVSSKKGIVKSLVDEIITASNSDVKSFSVGKRVEVERQAQASR